MGKTGVLDGILFSDNVLLTFIFNFSREGCLGRIAVGWKVLFCCSEKSLLLHRSRSLSGL